MKNRNKITTTTLGAIAVAGLISTGAVSAATTSSKGGMEMTSTSQTSVFDENLPMIDTGVQELGLSGRLNWEDNTDYTFDISYGKFVTPNWLVGVNAGITGVNSDKSYRAGVFGEYNFLTGTKWVPFIRTGVGYTRPNAGDDSAFIGVDAGIKYFMRSNLAIFASIGGDWVISGNSSSDGVAKQVDLGLKFYF